MVDITGCLSLRLETSCGSQKSEQRKGSVQKNALKVESCERDAVRCKSVQSAV